jgi:hypothetical protein
VSGEAHSREDSVSKKDEMVHPVKHSYKKHTSVQRNKLNDLVAQWKLIYKSQQRQRAKVHKKTRNRCLQSLFVNYVVSKEQ